MSESLTKNCPYKRKNSLWSSINAQQTRKSRKFVISCYLWTQILKLIWSAQRLCRTMTCLGLNWPIITEPLFHSDLRASFVNGNSATPLTGNAHEFLVSTESHCVVQQFCRFIRMVMCSWNQSSKWRNNENWLVIIWSISYSPSF